MSAETGATEGTGSQSGLRERGAGSWLRPGIDVDGNDDGAAVLGDARAAARQGLVNKIVAAGVTRLTAHAVRGAANSTAAHDRTPAFVRAARILSQLASDSPESFASANRIASARSGAAAMRRALAAA